MTPPGDVEGFPVVKGRVGKIEQHDIGGGSDQDLFQLLGAIHNIDFEKPTRKNPPDEGIPLFGASPKENSESRVFSAHHTFKPRKEKRSFLELQFEELVSLPLLLQDPLPDLRDGEPLLLQL